MKSMFACVCPEMSYKSTDDKQGTHSAEGVIIELKTNDGNKRQELIIIQFPLKSPRDTLPSWLSYSDALICLGSVTEMSDTVQIQNLSLTSHRSTDLSQTCSRNCNFSEMYGVL